MRRFFPESSVRHPCLIIRILFLTKTNQTLAVAQGLRPLFLLRPRLAPKQASASRLRRRNSLRASGLHHSKKNHENRLARSLCHTKNTNFQTHKTYKRHSGYFPWNHGKFICKGEGKWSCSGLRSYRSYGSEAMGWPYEQARRPPHRFRPTPLVASLPMTKIAIA